MIFLRWVFILLAFTIEVRVKALTQEPSKCVKKQNTFCSIFSSRSELLKWDHFEFGLTPGSILYRSSINEWNFISGSVRIHNQKNLSLKTKVGLVNFVPGIYWVQWREEQLWVYSILGEVKVQLLSMNNETLTLPEGFFNWYGLINLHGLNEVGIPRNLTLDVAKKFLPGLRRYSEFDIINKKETRSRMIASEIYREVAQNYENQMLEQLHRQEAREAFRISEEKRARSLFRQKFFGSVEN